MNTTHSSLKHRGALAWLGAILLAMTLGLCNAVADGVSFSLYLKNGTAEPVSFTIVPGSCWNGTQGTLGPVAPGGQAVMSVYRDQGSACDGESADFSIKPSASSEAQRFGASNDGGLWTFHTNRYNGELVANVPDAGSYTWTMRPLVTRLSGPVDERLTLPRSPIAYDTGSWGHVSGSTAKVETLKFANQPGMWGCNYQSCSGLEFFHVQHTKRLPNKNGRAYIMVSQSRGHNGWIFLMETNPGVLDPVTDLIRPSTDGAAIGRIIWQEVFTGSFNGTMNPIGNWNHPGKMSLQGGMLLINMQNWSEGKSVVHCTNSTSNNYQRGTDEDAVLFYDVRDPEHPKYWGKMTATDLNLPISTYNNGTDGNGYGGYAREFSAVSLMRSPTTDEWKLYAYGNGYDVTWKTSFISPNIEDWTLSSGGFGGQHGDEFNSYQWDSSRQVTTPPNGVERQMTFEVGNTALGNGENEGFTFSGGEHHMGLPYADRDWDSESLYITPQGVPVVYTMKTTAAPDGGSTNDADLIQVYDTRNDAANQTPHPVSSVVTNLFDSGPGSLRRAIGYGGSITFAPALNGRTITLTSGPLVVYPHNVNISAAALPKGISIVHSGNHGSPVLKVGAERLLTSSGLNFPAWITRELTPGDATAWFGQRATTHDGVEAFQSGDIADSEATFVETKVVGPGTLTFWWKISSESSYDYLRFRLDGEDVAATPPISGEVNWQQRTVNVPAGTTR